LKKPRFKAGVFYFCQLSKKIDARTGLFLFLLQPGSR
jgi:hypothetical protein